MFNWFWFVKLNNEICSTLIITGFYGLLFTYGQKKIPCCLQRIRYIYCKYNYNLLHTAPLRENFHILQLRVCLIYCCIYFFIAELNSEQNSKNNLIKRNYF